MEKQKKFNQRGITLVALVVTLILLLILAGITISSLTGSGLFENARLAKEKSDAAKQKEQGMLGDYENAINGYLSGISREDGTVSSEQYQALLAEIQSLKTQLQSSNERISKLENETIVNKRINLMNTEVNIPISTTSNESSLADIELSDSIENYKYLEIQVDVHWTQVTGNHLEKTMFIAIEELNYNNSNTVNWGNESTFTIDLNLAGIKEQTAGIICWFKDSKVLHVGLSQTSRADWDTFRIKNIYGIK